MKLSLATFDADRLPPPMRKVINILNTLSSDATRCDLFKFASAMAYVTLLSLVPSIAAIFAIVSLFSPILGESGQFIVHLKSLIIDNLASGSGEVAVNYLENFIANLNVAKIGVTGFAGITVSLILLLRNIEGALNRIFLVTRPRNIFMRFVYFWTFVTLGTVLTGISLGFLSGFDVSNLNPFAVAKADKGFWGFIFPKMSAFFFFGALYILVPNTKVRFQDAAFGALVATILFSIASRFYGVFTNQFTNYEAVYGAMAAIPLFLLWLYIVWLIILSGGLLSWRWSQGFESLANDNEGERLGLMDAYGPLGLQEMAIYGMLAMISTSFQSLEGKGVTMSEMKRQLKVPQDWLVLGANHLEGVGLITYRSLADGDSSFFPAVPLDQLSLEEISARIKEPVNNAFDNWLSDTNPTVAAACQRIWANRSNACSSDRWSDIRQS